MNDSQCPFEKAIISTRFDCECAERYAVAEREGVRCRSELAQTNCCSLVEHLRANAKFALRLTDPIRPLSHGQDMKIKCGGLLGLARGLTPDSASDRIPDIHALVQQAMQTYGTLAEIPYMAVVKAIAAYKHRR